MCALFKRVNGKPLGFHTGHTIMSSALEGKLFTLKLPDKTTLTFIPRGPYKCVLCHDNGGLEAYVIADKRRCRDLWNYLAQSCPQIGGTLCTNGKQ
ncbi:MAG: hypothetical protein LLF76_02660 [Planctomycetaceae bacterium]|nr:hypothetical protein [Planctomycetaceae bacterium]